MKAQSLKVFERMYKNAEKAEDLPWHSPEPPPQLFKAMQARKAKGGALDIGCGAGTYSLLMAKQGFAVTALDFMPQAVEMVTRAAAEHGVSINAVQGDVARWQCDQRFDLVLDVGCLHTPGAVAHETYKQQLLNWLAPGGDFILLHFGRRGWWDWWPIGPNRIYKKDIVALFAPELELVDYAPDRLEDMSIVLGFAAEVGRYWFRRPGSE